MIISDPTDVCGVEGPKEKYFLSTCNSEKGFKCCRRVPGFAPQVLLTLTGSHQMPQNKEVISTLEIPKEFSHIPDIADRISSIEANVTILFLVRRLNCSKLDVTSKVGEFQTKVS